MSPFVIFVIVLTIGYVLYYAAMITIDLTAKSKSEASAEETISTETLQDVEEDFVPKSVRESAEPGGFGFSISEEQEEDPIEEATEVPSVEDAPLELSPEDADTPDIADEQEGAEEDNSEVSDEVPSSGGEEAEPQDELLPEQELIEEPAIEVAESPVADEPEPTSETDVEEPEEGGSSDANDAFDQSLIAPKYDVSHILEPAPSEEAQTHANEVNTSLATRELKGNIMDIDLVKKVIRDRKAEQYNIETYDEYTQF